MISKNAAAILIVMLSFLGLEVGEDTALEVISAIGTFISFMILIWNQLDRRDTKWFFFKK